MFPGPSGKWYVLPKASEVNMSFYYSGCLNVVLVQQRE